MEKGDKFDSLLWFLVTHMVHSTHSFTRIPSFPVNFCPRFCCGPSNLIQLVSSYHHKVV